MLKSEGCLKTGAYGILENLDNNHRCLFSKLVVKTGAHFKRSYFHKVLLLINAALSK